MENKSGATSIMNYLNRLKAEYGGYSKRISSIKGGGERSEAAGRDKFGTRSSAGVSTSSNKFYNRFVLRIRAPSIRMTQHYSK